MGSGVNLNRQISDCELDDLIIAVIMVWVIVPKKPNPKAVITEIFF